MPALIHELKGSRNLSIGRDGASAPWRFMVRDAADETEAWQLAYDSTPPSYQPIPGISGDLLKTNIDTEDLGAGVYFVTVNYQSNQPTEAGADAGAAPSEPAGGEGDTTEGAGNVAGGVDPNSPLGREFTFTTVAAPEHINKARFEIDSGKVGGGAAPDAKLAIGLTREAVNGCDILTPNMEFGVTLQVRNLTISRFIRLGWATGRINLVPWSGFGEFEILYLGCDGKWSDGDSSWTITHRFKYQPTEKNIDIIGDGTLMCATKYGWDYLDVGYNAKNIGLEFFMQVPDKYRVYRVYHTCNFLTHLGFTLA